MSKEWKLQVKRERERERGDAHVFFNIYSTKFCGVAVFCMVEPPTERVVSINEMISGK